MINVIDFKSRPTMTMLKSLADKLGNGDVNWVTIRDRKHALLFGKVTIDVVTKTLTVVVYETVAFDGEKIVAELAATEVHMFELFYENKKSRIYQFTGCSVTAAPLTLDANDDSLAHYTVTINFTDHAIVAL